MQNSNLYIPQVREALKFYYKENIEYKRLSLILIDNIIEVLLKSTAIEKIDRYFNKNPNSNDHHKRIKELENSFDKITKELKDFQFITDEQKQILDFTHKIRNIQFHEPFPTPFSDNDFLKKLIEFGILCNIEFLISKSKNLSALETPLIKNMGFYDKSILNETKIGQPEELILLLCKAYAKKEKDPKFFLADIIAEDIRIIKEFFECEAREDWENFRNFTFNEFEYFLRGTDQKEYKKEIKNYPYLNEKRLRKLEVKLKNIKKLTTKETLEFYREFQNTYKNVIKGIALYQFTNCSYEADE